MIDKIDNISEQVIHLFARQRLLARQAAEWIAWALEKAGQPRLATSLLKHSMTPEEIERVRWRAEQYPND